MSYLPALALKSAWNRRYTLALTLLAIALSVAMLLGIERLRQDARSSFAQAVSGTDLVVGARTSPMQLMLYAVFRMGEPTANMGWASVEHLASHPAVAWAIPISLGDSHRGFAVVGSNAVYFQHFRHGDAQPLSFREGRAFNALFDAVIGAEVAERLGYRLGQQITLNHGSGEFSLAEHTDKPFRIVGILARTGTPVDRSVHVSLEAIEAIHLDWQGGAAMPGLNIPAEQVSKFDLHPKEVTAVLLGLKSRAAVFAVQRQVAGYRDEALTAVLPGVALAQLWDMLATGERALLAISALVVAVGLAGMVAVVLAGLNERRRELAILRSVGARPRDILSLLTLEGISLTAFGALLGVLLLAGLAWTLGPWLQAEYGLAPRAFSADPAELKLLGLVLVVGLASSLLPAWRAYRLSLADGLTPRI